MFTKNSDEITRQYFDSIMISTRYLDSDIPDISTEFFGKSFSTPVTTAALSHLHKICDNAMVEFALGAKNADALHFYGMGSDEELESILETGASTVKIIKPHEDDDEIFRRIEHAKRTGAFAIGMDIDHCVSPDGGYDVVMGLKMHTKTTGQISEYVKACGNIPFIVKGVLSLEDAVKSLEAGASGIVVSHHHGMMDYMTPPLLMLPEIVREVGYSMKIFVDCCIESGFDAYKCLALGADGVSVGRALMDPLKDGALGVTEKINKINNELRMIMARTGARTVKDIEPSTLRFRNF